MKKFTVVFLTLFAFLAITWLPTQVEAKVYRGCYHKKNGKLRIVKKNQKCRKSEKRISWYKDSSNYMGEYCSEIIEGGDVILTKMAVSHIGNGHYILTATSFKNGALHNVFHGSGEIVDNKIHMVLKHSGNSSVAMWSGICHGTTDSLSFNSNTTYECIGHDYNYTDLSLDTQYTTGYAISVACP
jgi:hypothetical protein